jgi:hypothetical protein
LNIPRRLTVSIRKRAACGRSPGSVCVTTRAALAAALALGLLAAPLAAPAQQPPGNTARIGFYFS